MRDILFRGKRLDNGEWVQGYYFIDERDIEDGVIWRSIPQIQQKYGDHFNYFDIDPATAGQYVGREDVNGKRIFEGDIVKQNDEIGIVHYEENYCTFVVILKRNPGLLRHIEYECEILGNVFD